MTTQTAAPSRTAAALDERARRARIRRRARTVLRAAGMEDSDIAVAMNITPAALRHALARDRAEVPETPADLRQRA